MSPQSAMSLTARLNNGLWSFRVKMPQTFFLGKYRWADFGATNPKEEGQWVLAMIPGSIQSHKGWVNQKIARVPVLKPYSKD